MIKPVVIQPYGYRRRMRIPRWLIVLVLGITLGVAGVLFVQQRLLPPRLSPAESARVLGDFAKADAERKQLAARLEQTTKQLEAALADGKKTAEALARESKALEPLRSDVAALVAALPPDPRGGAVAVRGGQMEARDGKLDYTVVLTHEGRSASASKPLAAQMRLIVAGEGARGESTVALDPVPVQISGHEIARGTADLPAGFRPRQTTIQISDESGSKPLGMRVLLVQR
jgi:hypothetical protein